MDVPRSFAQRVVALEAGNVVRDALGAHPQKAAALISERGMSAGCALVPRQECSLRERRGTAGSIAMRVGRAFATEAHVRPHCVLLAPIMRKERNIS